MLPNYLLTSTISNVLMIIFIKQTLDINIVTNLGSLWISNYFSLLAKIFLLYISLGNQFFCLGKNIKMHHFHLLTPFSSDLFWQEFTKTLLIWDFVLNFPWEKWVISLGKRNFFLGKRILAISNKYYMYLHDSINSNEFIILRPNYL